MNSEHSSVSENVSTEDDYETRFFEQFPVIEDQFDMISIDCIRMNDSGVDYYTPLIRYMKRDHVEHRVTGGMTLLTGAACESLSEVAEMISTLTKLGFFLLNISAFGTIYTEDMVEIEDVNWNNVIQLSSDDENHNTDKPVTYLH